MEMANSIPVAAAHHLCRPKIELSMTTKQYFSGSTELRKAYFFEQYLSPQGSDTCRQILEICRALLQKQGVHSTITMNTAGFYYTNKGDEARCDTCGLEVSGWTDDMQPFTIHTQRSPKCAFVRSILPIKRIILPSTISFTTITSASNDSEVPFRQKTDVTQKDSHQNILVEVNMLKQIRKRTFSHWPCRTSPSSAQIIEAGFFGCNVGDRVICLYCNIICQKWTPQTDDAFEVHKTLSPKCPYVIAMLKQQQTVPIPIVNEHSTLDNSVNAATNDPFRTNEIAYTAAFHAAYIELPKRHASFATWPNDNLPTAYTISEAGFFYTGTRTIVTCFHCNGSLQDIGPNDSPVSEHVRWFPHCAYAKQLCDPDLYRQIQETRQAEEIRDQENQLVKRFKTNISGENGVQPNIPDSSTMLTILTSRLDLPVSQSLLSRNFKLAVIKRCWRDQILFKNDDFVTDCDLLMACIILQKQMECIDGKRENIIVPINLMNKIPERRQHSEVSVGKEAALIVSLQNSSSNVHDEISTFLVSTINGENTPISAAVNQSTQGLEPSAAETVSQTQSRDSQPSNPCVLCLVEEKRLACIPCGHLATCVTCGHSLRSCPICRRAIEAFVRIYI